MIEEKKGDWIIGNRAKWVKEEGGERRQKWREWSKGLVKGRKVGDRKKDAVGKEEARRKGKMEALCVNTCSSK